MSKVRSTSPRSPQKRKQAAPPRPSWWRSLQSNAETFALIVLILAGLLLAGEMRQSSTDVGIMSRLVGWAARPLLLVLIVAALAVLADQTARRLRWALHVPWRLTGDVGAGLALASVALLGLSHLVADPPDPRAYALAGRGGGLVGWLIGSVPAQLLGTLTAGALLVVLIGLGVLVVLRSLDAFSWNWGEWAAQARDWLASWVRVADDAPEVETPAPRAAKRRPAPPRPDSLAERPSIVDPAEPAVVQPPKPPKTRRAAAAVAASKPEPTSPDAPPLAPRPEHLPPFSLLGKSGGKAGATLDLARKQRIIEETLASFNTPVEVVDINVGPTVTQFGVKPALVARRGPGGEILNRRVRVSRIRSLANDLALALEAPTIRIEAPAPGKGYVGIEVPNSRSDLVPLRSVLESPQYQQIKSPLALALGRDVAGQPVAADLAAMPHLLIAGATGSGKSVCIHSLVTSLLFNNGPDRLRLLLVDPKRVELPAYNGVPHLVAPVVTDVDQVLGALTWLTLQMDERYRAFAQVGARNIADYNRKAERAAKPADWGEMTPYPYIVFVVDELADLMLAAPDKIEYYICRLAQMARATGIHLVIATQRPSTDVVTGLIKANFPARIAFSVTSQIDSRVILDTPGAEKLLGRGDLLFMRSDSSKLDRIQGCFVSDKEITALARFWKQAVPPPELAPNQPRFPWTGLMGSGDEDDDQYEKALDLIQTQSRVSISWLQRRLQVSYHRAAELVARMESDGYVGPDEGAGRGREVLLAVAPHDGEDDWLS